MKSGWQQRTRCHKNPATHIQNKKRTFRPVAAAAIQDPDKRNMRYVLTKDNYLSDRLFGRSTKGLSCQADSQASQPNTMPDSQAVKKTIDRSIDNQTIQERAVYCLADSPAGQDRTIMLTSR